MVSSTVPPSCFPVARHCTGTRPSGHADLSLFRYWLRQNGPSLILSPGYPCVETRQGAVVQQIFWAWIPLLGVDKVADLLRIIAGQYTRKQHFQFLRQLKLTLCQTIQEHAPQYLESRVNLQLLPGGVSWKWLTSLATVPKLAVHGVARFAILRWQ